MVREIRCPVCWGNVDSNVVACDRCESPHHDDCFAFADGCGVFGCGSTGSRGYQPPPPGETIALDPAVEPPPRLEGLPRTLGRRILDAYGCLGRNWRLAVCLAAMQATLVALAGLSVGLSPLHSDLADYLEMRAPHIQQAVVSTVPRTTLPRPAVPTDTPPLRSLPLEIGALGVFVLDALNILGLFFMVAMVAGLLGRSRGKQLTAVDLIAIARSRIGRVVTTVLTVGFRIAVPACCMLALALISAGALGSPGWVIAPLFLLAGIGWAVYAGNLFSLAVTIAAVGPEEEPGDPLARSAELVGMAPVEILIGYWVVGILQGFVILIVGGAMGIVYRLTGAAIGETGLIAGVIELGMLAVVTTLFLTMPCYNVLLYIECRKARDAKDLPYFPSEMTGARS